VLKVSIIVPVYNERKNIDKILSEIEQVGVEKEIIVVDDFSCDGTRDYLKKKQGVKVIYHQSNMGKGAAIRSGLARVSGDVVIIQDADLEYSPREIPGLLLPIKEGKTKVVYGSRFLGRGEFLKSSFYANRFLTELTNLLYDAQITDMETCYKVIETKLLRSLNLVSSRFEIEPEITCKILKKGERIVELPISYKGRKTGKKIGIKDGIQAIYNLIKWRFKR
jgi:glycosyltransferase involved in cell wall biosynthesis